MLFLAPFSTTQYKKLGPGPDKVPKDPKSPKKPKNFKKGLSYPNRFMKFGLTIAYIPFSK